MRRSFQPASHSTELGNEKGHVLGGRFHETPRLQTREWLARSLQAIDRPDAPQRRMSLVVPRYFVCGNVFASATSNENRETRLSLHIPQDQIDLEPRSRHV